MQGYIPIYPRLQRRETLIVLRSQQIEHYFMRPHSPHVGVYVKMNISDWIVKVRREGTGSKIVGKSSIFYQLICFTIACT